MQKPGAHSKDWIAAGGVLGAAILLARFTRTPLASVLQAIPYLLHQFNQAEARRAHTTPSAPAQITREEARLILGVSSSASHDDIREAHKRLIQKNHPDLGGTDYLAAKINQARDVLLS